MHVVDFVVVLGLAPWVVLAALFALLVLLLAALVLAPLWAPLAAALSHLGDCLCGRDRTDDTKPR